MFKKKPGYSVVIQTPSGRDSGRVLVEDGLVKYDGTKVLGVGTDTELHVDSITAISQTRDTYYRVTLRVGVDAVEFLMTPKDGKALVEDIRQAQST